MTTLRLPSSPALLLAVTLAGCRPATPAPVVEAPPPPYPPALAAQVDVLLPRCHAGLLRSCEELADALLAAGYWREAASSLAYACWLPAEVAFDEDCDQWLAGACAPDACACVGQPDCELARWCGGAEEREFLCGDGSHAACIQRQQIDTCRAGGGRLERWALRRDNDADVVCSDTRVKAMSEAVEFTRRACEEFPVAARERWSRYGNHGTDVCESYEVDLDQIRECQDFRADMARHEAEMAASSARFQAELGRQLAAGIGDIAGTARQIDAANQGKIVAHQRVEVPVVNLAAVPTSADALGDALVASVPEILRSVARLHPKQEALFQKSALALLVIRRELAARPTSPPAAVAPPPGAAPTPAADLPAQASP